MAATDERVRCWASGARAGLSLKELEQDLASLQQVLRAGARRTLPVAHVADRAQFHRAHGGRRTDDLDADAAISDACGPPGAVSWTDEWRRWRADLDLSQDDPGAFTGMLVKLDSVLDAFRRGVADALR